MIDLNTYIKESLFDDDLVTKDVVVYQPKTKRELVDCILKEIDRQGGHDANLNGIDTSKIFDMSDLFYEFPAIRNIDISEWDVSLVESMLCMFDGCKNFNCDLSKWDVGNVKDMRYMFNKCRKLKKLPSWFNP